MTPSIDQDSKLVEAVAREIEAAHDLHKQAIDSVADAERQSWEPWGIEQKIDAVLFICQANARAIRALFDAIRSLASDVKEEGR